MEDNINNNYYMENQIVKIQSYMSDSQDSQMNVCSNNVVIHVFVL